MYAYLAYTIVHILWSRRQNINDACTFQDFQQYRNTFAFRKLCIKCLTMSYLAGPPEAPRLRTFSPTLGIYRCPIIEVINSRLYLCSNTYFLTTYNKPGTAKSTIYQIHILINISNPLSFYASLYKKDFIMLRMQQPQTGCKYWKTPWHTLWRKTFWEREIYYTENEFKILLLRVFGSVSASKIYHASSPLFIRKKCVVYIISRS